MKFFVGLVFELSFEQDINKQLNSACLYPLWHFYKFSACLELGSLSIPDEYKP